MSKLSKVKSAKTAVKTVKIINNPSSFVSLNDVNFQNLNLGKSGRSVKLIYDKQSMNMSTNVLYMPFNLNTYKKQWSTYDDYIIDCYIDSGHSDNEYIQKMSQFNDVIFDLVKTNLHLFNVPENEQICFTPFYKDNKTFPKLLKLHLPRDTNGNFMTQFFDENSNKIFVDENNIQTILSKKSTFKTIINCSKVYMYQNRAGCAWDIMQLKLVNATKEIAISDSSDNGSASEEDNTNDNNHIYTQIALID